MVVTTKRKIDYNNKESRSIPYVNSLPPNSEKVELDIKKSEYPEPYDIVWKDHLLQNEHIRENNDDINLKFGKEN